MVMNAVMRSGAGNDRCAAAAATATVWRTAAMSTATSTPVCTRAYHLLCRLLGSRTWSWSGGQRSVRRWFSGRMLACHAGGPGSIPGRRILLPSATQLPTRFTFIVSSAIRPLPSSATVLWPSSAYLRIDALHTPIAVSMSACSLIHRAVDISLIESACVANHCRR